ncbi:hypothetical protein Micbo1qcDRAFT_209005 [Microdochium bolleyi]|uniref:DUF7587 domain-containing protein n=1 Tax=Microdochium bolleyi TaxID=196109 RepID=A0A136INT9_9PEZI|nr:hypothetical protein Micbo1qcDRAFT_209005 [Microdochium bolleyi]
MPARNQDTRDEYGFRIITEPRATQCAIRRPHEKPEDFRVRAVPLKALEAVRDLTADLRDETILHNILISAVEHATCLLPGAEAIKLPRPGIVPVRFEQGDLDELAFLELERVQLAARLDIQQQHNALLRVLLQTMHETVLRAQVIPGQPQAAPHHYHAEGPFYRFHRPRLSATKHKPGLGLLCSGWRSHGDGIPTTQGEQVQQHLEGIRNPSPLISVSDSLRRIWNLVLPAGRTWLRDSDRDAVVYVISPSRLRRLGVRFEMSMDLVEQVAGREVYSRESPGGVRFATPSHWLVYSWIPEACILAKLTTEEFWGCCAAAGIEGSDTACPRSHARQTGGDDSDGTTDDLDNRGELSKAVNSSCGADQGGKQAPRGEAPDGSLSSGGRST